LPELPEVETVRRGLEPALKGARLSGVSLFRADLRFPFPESFTQRLEGAQVIRLERRAKYLLAYLDTDHVWVTHLGMTGRFQVDQLTPGGFYHNAEPVKNHRHFSLIATTDAGESRIDYYDPRRFGFMHLLNPDELAGAAWWQGLGVEPLSGALDADFILTRFKGRRQGLKTLLMDQRLIAGLGNIYVCEALYRSGLHPDMAGDALKPAQAETLATVIKAVLGEAIEAGGASISDFTSTSGALGYFQHRFKVYDREGEPCLTPGCGGTIERAVHSGRSTFFCAVCQNSLTASS
jgi:formamidopyrimidine-DNA glycosylase